MIEINNLSEGINRLNVISTYFSSTIQIYEIPCCELHGHRQHDAI